MKGDIRDVKNRHLSIFKKLIMGQPQAIKKAEYGSK